MFAGPDTYTGSTFINQGILGIQNSSGLGLNTSTEQTISISGATGTLTFGFAGYPGTVTTGACPRPG